MHTICFTEYVLSVYCVNVQYVMTRKIDCRKVLYCDTNEISTISGPKYKASFYEYISLGHFWATIGW